MKSNLTLLALIVLMSSCAIHNGSISSNAVAGNIEYMDVAYGVSQTTKIFGIGGLSKDALVMEAKRNLMRNNPLKPGEQYVNFTLDIKRSLFLVVFNTKLTLSADIVKVNQQKTADVFSKQYLDKLSNPSNNNELFEIGDVVLFGRKFQEGEIISMDNQGNLRIRPKNDNNKYKSIQKSITEVYVKNKTYKGLTTGDYYAYIIDRASNEAVGGKIIAVGIKKFLFEDATNGGKHEIPYK